MEKRDRLIATCRGRGSQRPTGPAISRFGGLLDHPYLGFVRAFCSRIVVRESRADLGFAAIELEFLETRVEPLETAPTSPAVTAAEAARTAKDAAGEVAEAALVTEGVPEHARNAIAAVLQDLGSTLQVLDVFRGLAQDASTLGFQITTLINRSASLAISPALAVTSVRATIDTIITTTRSAFDALSVYETLFGIDTDTDGTLASSVEQTAARNGQATVELVRVQALAGAIDAAAQVQWQSLDQALDRRGRLLAQLEVFEAACASASVCSALNGLRAALNAAVPPPNAHLEHVATVTPPETLAGLTLAYRLYDGGSNLQSRLEDLALRNKVPHPGFLPGGVPLEVLLRE
jgi:hypothetical protein